MYNDYELEGEGTGEETVDRTQYVAVGHDSFGEKYVNYADLVARAPMVTVRRVLGSVNIELREGMEVFVDGQPATADTVVSAGQAIFVVGKLAGGR